MQPDLFLVGRYIHWQGSISQITACSTSGQIRLEHFLTRNAYTVELATLQQALATDSLCIGIRVEQTFAEANEQDDGTQSQDETSLAQSDTVITYLPTFNVESFFTTSQPSFRKRQRFIRRKTRHAFKAKRGVLARGHQPSEGLSEGAHLFSMHISPAKAGKSKGTTQEHPSARALKRAFQSPGKITIRWLNSRQTNLLTFYSLEPLAEEKIDHPLGTFNYEVEQRTYELAAILATMGLKRPIYILIIDEWSHMIIGVCIAFAHI